MTWREKCGQCSFEAADVLDVLEHEWAAHSPWTAAERLPKGVSNG